MDFSKIAAGLEKVLETVQILTPLAKKIGGPMLGSIAEIVEAGAKIGENALERAKEGSIVLTSRDETAIRTIIADLRGANNELMAEIDAS